MNLKQQLEAALKAAREIAEKAKNEQRNLTADEQSDLDSKLSEVDDLKGKITDAQKSDDLMAKIANLAPGDAEPKGDGDKPAKSLGEHFVKAIGKDGLSRIKTVSGATAAAPEFTKANDDTHETPDSLGPWLTQYDRTVVRAFRRPVVSDVFGTGTMGDSNAVTYLVEGDADGDFDTVAQGGSKPQFHIGDPTTKTDALKKIAGFIQITDEMAEDANFWVSEINNRGLYMLALAEEKQLLTGSGSGANIEGLLKREGVQSESASDKKDNADALFRAMTKVQTATGLTAEGIIVNPSDYQTLRLGKDGNGQYFGGGYFQGQYGNGDQDVQPPLWGVQTIVSAAVDQGTAVVGAFSTAATVYRKGGVRVESTNSHADTFTSNLITTRIGERIALAVRIPKAFVKVSLSDSDPSSSE